MARDKVKSATDQRPYTIVYDDFLECELLNYYEKLIFIAIKRFTSENKKPLQAFPSLNRLHKMTKISRSKIQEVITSLEEKGILKIEHRDSKEKGHQSNLYTLYDFRELWKAGSVKDIPAAVDDYETKSIISLLESKGYIVRKADKIKELDAPTDQSSVSSPQLNQFDIVNTTPNSSKSQALERYSMQDIKSLYDYECLITDNRAANTDIDIVMQILYDTLNCTKPTIRISGQDKPTMIVISKLMKIGMDEILWSIEQYHKTDKRITNVSGYLLTILYNSKEQSHLDLMNLGHYNGDF